MTGNSDSSPRPTTPRDLHAGQPVVTMIGGGQLARMTHQAAIALGQTLRVLSGALDEPAAQVSPDVVLGSHTDLNALREAAVGSHALTFDHEHVPTEHLDVLVAEGVNVQPPPQALVYAQDKLAMRRKLGELGAPVPAFAEVTWAEDVVKFGAQHGWPLVIKAVRGGYDGRGVWITDDSDEAERIVTQQLDNGVALLVEEKVDMRRELSAMVARSPFGQGATWPVVETVQRHGQCAVVLAPAPQLPQSLAAEAEGLALRLASELGVVGAMAVELFETSDGTLVVNELAMRPHNSGHWTMDGARTSQFEQHLRAVLDYPLGDTAPIAPLTVMANVLGAPTAPEMSMDERVHHLFARMPDAKVHLYGKGERRDRKIGHVNIVGGPGSLDDPEYVAAVRERAERAAHWLSHAEWTDGWDVHGE
ncbi:MULTISPECIES: 5-(carboxyamino)imidazole ribonucleotide synthase [Rhodococcus]|uniref:N5-carboxyaminoimidazole ribonucleotide synthase n=1 Tax=Rhodococcus oxybenzonivorans TaxID=1990687 RepID=A0AAE5A9K6_9NOCA|nr:MULTISPECIES: 5-(carboxyamino)imidazole ribonucleotide synthase [Rhodococcus]MDV7244585.1 5-(carboxyamino)imidazole ribonucleotide synthase [Rhodococcus oxybenzonivorans]MDV7268611.1 5-(carboxyamino)imidazole ribonucleotide synthase [Rhodococcus oxybenzonivorans]MDV7275914.1 5-(carboxyamino)imidazole ribonucleotide synthase [Rhodococcus oxybenzonivorans]MDV7332693.1 5-(carboxyamino)imidazole ribonucleotide synthase [Rhodococcus oxybenzonivorans]MDV7346489.1 5-(carboxyamino)imidazole ribonuc